MPAPRYELLAIDLDGTLIDHAGRLPEANVRAIHAARSAGITVAIATGRALIETRAVLEKIGRTGPAIVAGGAIVADAGTGVTLERFTLELGLVRRVHDHLRAHEHPVLLLKDPHAAGYDYLVVTPDGPEAVDPASRWWFSNIGARVRYCERLEDDEHPEHTVRVGAYCANHPVTQLADELRERFGAQAMLQHFHGVLLPADRRELGIESVHIVELFHLNADKWQALDRLAGRLGVAHERIAAIGDQTNDLSMLTHAGLGIAMGNATPAVKAAANVQTGRCEDAGVADAIDRILSGAW